MDDRVQSFIQSALFSKTFREGMALVEETANYLDGDGRELSKGMERSEALSYASSSMRLTTQLMQIASWLLVMRALREGDMSPTEASESKYRIRAHNDAKPRRALPGHLPEMLTLLIKRSDQLYDQIARLDEGMFSSPEQLLEPQGAVAQQVALANAFGQKKL